MTMKNANEREHLLAPIRKMNRSIDNLPLLPRRAANTHSSPFLRALCVEHDWRRRGSKHALVSSSTSSAQLGMMNPSKGFQKIEKAIENSFEVFNRADVHHDPSNRTTPSTKNNTIRRRTPNTVANLGRKHHPATVHTWLPARTNR